MMQPAQRWIENAYEMSPHTGPSLSIDTYDLLGGLLVEPICGGASDESSPTPQTDAIMKACGLRGDEEIVKFARCKERELFLAWQERNKLIACITKMEKDVKHPEMPRMNNNYWHL